MHEARAEKMSDTIGAKVLVKITPKLHADRRVWSECVSRCRVKVKGNRMMGLGFFLFVLGSL